MTKEQEIAHWRKFVNDLPDGYLKAMFAGSEDRIENMIRNDFAYDPLPQLHERIQQATQDNNKLAEQNQKLHQQKLELETKTNNLKRTISTYEATLHKIRQEAHLIATSALPPLQMPF